MYPNTVTSNIDRAINILEKYTYRELNVSLIESTVHRIADMLL